MAHQYLGNRSNQALHDISPNNWLYPFQGLIQCSSYQKPFPMTSLHSMG